jgi:hypothetical protein
MKTTPDFHSIQVSAVTVAKGPADGFPRQLRNQDVRQSFDDRRRRALEHIADIDFHALVEQTDGAVGVCKLPELDASQRWFRIWFQFAIHALKDLTRGFGWNCAFDSHSSSE